MSYALNCYEPMTLVQDLVRKIRQEPHTGTWWALVDTAFDYPNPTPCIAEPNSVIKVYATGLVDLHRVSPMAILLSKSMAKLVEQLTVLLTHCNGRPMLSFIQCDLSPQSLENKLHGFQSIQTTDEEMYTLRFADTRIIEALVNGLEQRNFIYLVFGFKQWIIIDRNGVLKPLNLQRLNLAQVSFAEATALAEEPCMKLSDSEFIALLNQSEGDTLYHTLQQRHSEVLARQSPAACHQILMQVLQFLREECVEDSAVTIYLSLIALQLDQTIFQYTDFLAGWKETRDRRDFVKQWYIQYFHS